MKGKTYFILPQSKEKKIILVYLFKKEYMTQITENIVNNICNEYKNGKTLNKLSIQYKISEKRVKKILEEHSIKLQQPHKITKSSWNYEEENQKRYPLFEGMHYVAISKIDGTKFNDYLNKSGSLTNHIHNKLNIEIPSLYKRKKYFKENNIQWYEQWFSIIQEIDKPTKKCPYCTWETIDIENKSGMFLTHLLKEHNITKNEHLKLHPEDRQYLALVNKSLDRKVENNNNKYVVCKICGEKFARLDWRHFAKHGITKEDYIKKYGEKTVSTELHDNLSKKCIEINKNMIPKYKTKPEEEIQDFIDGFGIKCETNNRKILNGKEIDIYIPSKKIGIEYNGNFWHCEGVNNKTSKSHLEKTEIAQKNGIQLIQIFEDEYILNHDIVFSKIQHILGLENKNNQKIYARKCIVKEINNEITKVFLNNNHIQGYAEATYNIGAFYDTTLVGVMQFKEINKNSNNWELTRCATVNGFVCCGLASKMFSYFNKNYKPIYIKSFADRRWTINETNNLYIKLGFKLEGYVEPNYRYYNPKVNRYKRFHKFGFKKQILNRKYGLPLTMTESEMTEKLGFKKIWDCGLIKYVWKNNEELGN